MWSSFSYTIPNFGWKKNSAEPSTACSEFSDDETCSNIRTEDGLECQICFESFNIVENVPYVLWCGHTLCKNCLLGLDFVFLKFSTQQIQIPFFISCPWCNLLTLRLVYEGNLKFPRKNFFLLWMVESFNGERTKSPLCSRGHHQSSFAPRSPFALGNQAGHAFRRATFAHRLGRSEPSNGHDVVRPQLTLHKSINFLIRLTTKFPLVVILVLLVVCVLPASAVILALYVAITVLLALPSFLVLYFAYPGLSWLVREITT